MSRSVRFILRYRGPGQAPAADLERIRATSDLAVLDETPRMLLVGAAPEIVSELVAGMPMWVAVAERSLSLPDPRPRPRRGPGGGRS